MHSKATTTTNVRPEQRFRASKPCPICGGHGNKMRGIGERCMGFSSVDGEWARCSREEHAGNAPWEEKTGAYVHKLTGDCKCGAQHSFPTSGLPPNSEGNGHARREKGQRGRIVATYDYRDERGHLQYQVVRHEPKSFCQRRPGTDSEQWIWDLAGVRRILYRLPELLNADAAEIVVYPEGEKDSDRAAAEGFVSTTNARGAKEFRPEYADALRGRHVAIFVDNDKEGREGGEKKARGLHGNAASVKVVELPGLPEKGDLSDWFDQGGTADKLRQMINDAPEWTSSEPEGNGKVEYPLTDTGNAERLAARHGKDLRYVYAWNAWLRWSGKKWRVDDTGEINRRAKETVRAIYGEAASASDTSASKQLANHAMKSEGESRLRAMISLAQSEDGIPIRVEDLDTDPWLLNVENGTIDLKAGELREHRREYLITKIAPVMYNPNAKAPTWEAFLERILPSEGLRRFVQRIIGYSLTGDVSAQILPFLYGTGANGKSTLLNTVFSVLGDYGQQAAPELLLSKRGAHPTELADLKGARLVASVEIEDGLRMAESLVKQLTGGEKIKARYLHKDFFEFNPTHKVFLAANHKPEVQGTDHAIWRRVKLIPFEVTIPDEEQDPHLLEKLQAERPGILAWAVRGCLDWQREGLGEPPEVKDATEEYRAEMDVLADFMRECCVVHPEVWCVFAELYESYETWCEESGERAESKRKFGARLKERGYSPDNGARNIAIRRGIALRDDRRPDGSGVNEQSQDINPEKRCKSLENGKEVNDGYLENENYARKPLTKEVSEKTLTNINSLTPKQLKQIGKLVSEGMDSDLARKEVIGEVEVGVV